MIPCVATFALVLATGPWAAAQDAASPVSGFRLLSEHALGDFGGIPFLAELDGDGRPEVLWLQSPGIFHSRVFDVPPWRGRFTPEERDHFCLTATDIEGRLIWQLGEPWTGNRPFVTHCGERALDCADLEGDGAQEVVCIRRHDILIIEGRTGKIRKAVEAPADNAQIVCLARTGAALADWTILVQNSESAYPPHEYANPTWFYNGQLELLKTAAFRGAGHAPVVRDLDADGLDEFVTGFHAVDNTLEILWSYRPVAQGAWDAVEMHVDSTALGNLGGKQCAAFAASDMTHVLDVKRGTLLWKRPGTHPQYCVIGRFRPELPGHQVLVHNKRAELQLFDDEGHELWHVIPPPNFPLGQAEPCKRQAFHAFDPLTVLRGMGAGGGDLVVLSDVGWPYVMDGQGRRCLDFPPTDHAAQDWGEVPGRPDDYGYGYYVRTADWDGDGVEEVLISDRRYAWLHKAVAAPPVRSE